MRSPRFALPFLSALGLLALVVFQNCGEPSPSGSSPIASVSVSSDRGNGHGYDGKPYVLIDTSGACATNVRARIYDQGSGHAILTRENCAEIAPRSLAAGSFRVRFTDTSSVLDYNGDVYVEEFSASPQPSPTPMAPALVLTCLGQSQSYGQQINLELVRSGNALNLHLKISTSGGLIEDSTYPMIDIGADPGASYRSEQFTPEHGNIVLLLTTPVSAGGTLKWDIVRAGPAGPEIFQLTSCTAK